MKIEIEAKLKIDSPDQLTEKLAKLGAKYIEQQNQTDIYLDNSSSKMRTEDLCLRIRTQQTELSQKVFITYKGPKQPGKYKSRREIEFQADSSESAQQLFAALGFSPTVKVEKLRRLWQFENSFIAIDQVKDLGTFLEIESPDENKVYEIQEKLGLSDLHHITESYACLISEKHFQQ